MHDDPLALRKLIDSINSEATQTVLNALLNASMALDDRLSELDERMDACEQELGLSTGEEEEEAPE